MRASEVDHTCLRVAAVLNGGGRAPSPFPLRPILAVAQMVVAVAAGQEPLVAAAGRHPVPRECVHTRGHSAHRSCVQGCIDQSMSGCPNPDVAWLPPAEYCQASCKGPRDISHRVQRLPFPPEPVLIGPRSWALASQHLGPVAAQAELNEKLSALQLATLDPMDHLFVRQLVKGGTVSTL